MNNAVRHLLKLVLVVFVTVAATLSFGQSTGHLNWVPYNNGSNVLTSIYVPSSPGSYTLKRSDTGATLISATWSGYGSAWAVANGYSLPTLNTGDYFLETFTGTNGHGITSYAYNVPGGGGVSCVQTGTTSGIFVAVCPDYNLNSTYTIMIYQQGSNTPLTGSGVVTGTAFSPTWVTVHPPAGTICDYYVIPGNVTVNTSDPAVISYRSTHLVRASTIF